MILTQWLVLVPFRLVWAVSPNDVPIHEAQQPLKNDVLAIGPDSLLATDIEQRPYSGRDSSSKDPSSLLALHKALVSIPSTSGSENAIALFLQRYLQSHNLTVELQPVGPLIPIKHGREQRNKQRYNVFAYPPRHRQTPLLLTSHIDTVPPHIPYSVRGDGEIWGRGTVDAKACIATQLVAYAQLVASGEIEASEASFLFVSGEEIGGDGMSVANELDLEWETVIFGEPTELKLASGHKGLMMLKIKAEGKGGHSGYPELAESAVDMLLPALLKLKKQELEEEGLRLPSSDKYGNSTVNIGLVRAGVAANVIAQTAEAEIGIRIAAGDPQLVKDMVLETVKSVNEKLQVEFSHAAEYGPVDIDADVPGFERMTVNYGTDIPNLKGRHKRYLYGPGSILVAHSDHEHLNVQDLYNAVEGYKKLIRHALGQRDRLV
ncbi:MAG: hypothetical protein Q9163_003641 [Psora crenata]